jgi:tetratricopeptide (TPR) repeat protein
MSKTKPNGTRTGQRPSRSELRASIVWPVVIAVVIWLAGLIIYIVAPGRFDLLVSGLIAAGLLVYLIWYQRSLRITPSERILSLLLATPAVLGIAFGLFYGNAIYAITGVSLSLLLLAAQRALTVPFSYRMARRSFSRGRPELALDLVDKAIDARPGFWESYQLRALIYLSALQFGQAERDALKALELRPDAHPVHNTLGQLYLAGSQYERAAEAYSKAIDLSPKHALYHYHQGVALYRLGEARDAAEALAAATRLGLPDVSYELQAYYYLGRALEGNGEIEKAEEVFADMVKFKDGLELLRADLKQQPDFPELAALRADLRDLEKRLAAAEREATTRS